MHVNILQRTKVAKYNYAYGIHNKNYSKSKLIKILTVQSPAKRHNTMIVLMLVINYCEQPISM